MDEFEKEKIVYAETMRVHKGSDADRFPRFSYNKDGYFTDKTCFFATGKNLKYIVAVMNSSLGEYMIYRYVTKLDTGGFNMQSIFIELLPIPKIPEPDQKPFETLVDYIIYAKANSLEMEAKFFESVIDVMVYGLYFEDDMRGADCYIFDEVKKLVSTFDGSKEMVEGAYKKLKENKTVMRGLTYSRTVDVVKIINGVKND